MTGSISEFYSLISLPNALNGATRFKSFCVFFGTAPHIKLHTFLGMHIICPIMSRLRPILLSQSLETNLLLDLVLVFSLFTLGTKTTKNLYEPMLKKKNKKKNVAISLSLEAAFGTKFPEERS